jgi:hypothetical protein
VFLRNLVPFYSFTYTCIHTKQKIHPLEVLHIYIKQTYIHKTLCKIQTVVHRYIHIASHTHTHTHTHTQIVDRQLIYIIFSYSVYASFKLQPPVVLDVYPDHVLTNVLTTFTVTGQGLTKYDKIKIVHSSLGCGPQPGVPNTWVYSKDINPNEPVLPDWWGTVKGGEGTWLNDVNVLGTNATVVFTIVEPYVVKRSMNEYRVCYR